MEPEGFARCTLSTMNYELQMVFREQALALPGIGKALADKIMEMVEDGRIRKVDEVLVIIIMIIRKVEEVCSSEKVKVLSIFSDVWGAGPKTAQAWWDRWVSFLMGHCLQSLKSEVQTPFSLKQFHSSGDSKAWTILKVQT